MTVRAGQYDRRRSCKPWSAALAYALPVAGIVLALDYYWFGVADRYVVFLYYHDMGTVVPDTSPFSRVTSSRYWMAGLVAGGIVAALYLASIWALGRLAPGRRSPAWWRVWALCVPLLAVGIPAITMTANQPTLPPARAAQVTLVTLAGLAVALMPGRLAAESPHQLIPLGLDGCGLMLLALNLSHLEMLPRWLARGGTLWVWLMAAGTAAGLVWLLLVTGWHMRRRRPGPGALPMFIAMLFLAYLMMPLAHHLVGTDGYFYISDSDNFFARSVWMQIATWLTLGGIACGTGWIRGRLCRRRIHFTDKGG